MTAIAMGTLAGYFIANAQSVPVIQITPQSLGNGAVNASYSEMLNASSSGTSGPFSWTIFSGSLPPGLSLQVASSGTGAVISGTPTAPGAYNFTLDATNGTTATTQMYSVDIEGSGAATSTIMPIVVVTPVAVTTTVTTTTTTTLTVVSSTLEMDLQNAELELADLEEALQESSGGTAVSPTTGPVFSRDLTIGNMGADVLALQEFLNRNGYPVATSGPGSSGNETDYFGSLTQTALARWQAANGISPAQGYYGPTTRAKINLMMTGTVSPGPAIAPSPANSAPSTNY